MFRCVQIFSNGDIKELELSTSGGLENDALQYYCKRYFQPPDISEQRQVIEQALKQQGTDPTTIDERLLQNCGDFRVEIKTLAPPTPINSYTGVSMYCNANAGPHNSNVNERATSIAMKCGYSTPIYGDVFISRVFDKEDMEWTRKDFCEDDLLNDASWLVQAEAMNRGRNMDTFSTSGTLSNLSKPTAADTNSGNSILQWSQTTEDVEVRMYLPFEYSAKDVKVVMTPSHLKISFPSPISSDDNKDLMRIQAADGAELFSRIKVDESGWSMDAEKGNKCLQITLSKAVEGLRWLTLTR